MELIEKTLRYGGKEEQVFFRELTAGEQYELAKGQRFKSTQKDGGVFEFDMGEQLAINQRMVQMILVDADGKNVYRNLEALRKEPAKKVNALVKLAKETLKELGEGDEGNE
jgi:hypothetical protein